MSVDLKLNGDNLKDCADKYFDFCVKILDYKNSGLKVNPFVVRITKFRKVFNLMSKDEHQALLLESIYEPNRKNILKLISDASDYDWLKEKNVKIIIKNDERSVMCSSAFKRCLDLKIEAEKRLEGLPDSAAEDAEELNFPDIYMLYFYRMLRECVLDFEENAKIVKNVVSIESDLGVIDNKNPQIKSTQSSSTPGNNPLQDILGNVGPALSNLMSNMNNGQNGGMPDIGKLLQSIVGNNAGLGKMVGETFGDLGDCKSPQEMLQKTLGKLGSSDLQSKIGSVLGNLSGSMGGMESKSNSSSSSSSLSLMPSESGAIGSLGLDPSEQL